MHRAVAGVVAALLILGVSAVVAEETKPDETNLSKHWQQEFGLEERIRYEYKQDFDFNESVKDNGSLFFHRLKLNSQTSLLDDNKKNILDVFIEGLDAQTGSFQTKATATQVDNFDLHQAYVNLHRLLGQGIDVKVGRQEIVYGAGRLIAQPAWSNRMRHFDAAVAHFYTPKIYADLIYAQDVKYDDNNFNRSLDEEYLTGVYSGYQKDKNSFLLEGYFLAQVVNTTDLPTTRYTVGGRWQGKLPADILCDVEIPFQFGHAGTKDIRAMAAHVDFSKELTSWTWKPKWTLELNRAGGDIDPNDSEVNTFNPLYQSTHTPYGDLDFFRWQNMREVALNVSLSPTKKLKLRPQTNFFWLDSKFDSWVNASGTTLRSQTSGDRNYYVGQELSLKVNYDVSKNIKLESGYAHFFTGGFIKDTGADDDVDWF